MSQPNPNRSVPDPAFKLLVTVIGLLLAVLLGALVYGFVSNLLISRELQTLLKQISVYEKPGENPPSGERIGFLESGINQMNAYLEELRSQPFMKDTLRGKRTGDALALKESLYGIERKLRERSDQASVTWPKSFGFEQLQSTIPSEEELPDLFYQIEILEEIGNAIVKVGTVSVEKFEFRSSGVIARSAEGATPLDQAPVGRLEQRHRAVGAAKQSQNRPEIASALLGTSPRNDGSSEFLLDVQFTASFDRFVKLLDEIRRLEHLTLVTALAVKPAEKDPSQIEGQCAIRVVYA